MYSCLYLQSIPPTPAQQADAELCQKTSRIQLKTNLQRRPGKIQRRRATSTSGPKPVLQVLECEVRGQEYGPDSQRHETHPQPRHALDPARKPLLPRPHRLPSFQIKQVTSKPAKT